MPSLEAEKRLLERLKKDKSLRIRKKPNGIIITKNTKNNEIKHYIPFKDGYIVRIKDAVRYRASNKSSTKKRSSRKHNINQ